MADTGPGHLGHGNSKSHIWVAGTQLLEPTPLSPRISTRKFRAAGGRYSNEGHESPIKHYYVSPNPFPWINFLMLIYCRTSEKPTEENPVNSQRKDIKETSGYSKTL